LMTKSSYRVLARKYRPTALNDLVGQELLIQTLSQAILNNRLPHAFVLHGIRGVGKTTTARIIARVLNCQNNKMLDKVEACGTCASCQSLNDDRHLDVIEIDAASRTGVDDVREIIDSSQYKAVTGQYKIFIIDEVHMLSKSAFNALLKTLEEPPAHVKFIFATTEIRKIPDTILSRCMRFDLKRIDINLIAQHLKNVSEKENFGIEDEAAMALARAADGSMRDGLSLLDQALALSYTEENSTVGNNADQSNTDERPLIKSKTVYDMLGLANRSVLFDLLGVVFKGDTAAVLQQTQRMINEGADPQLLMQELLEMVYGFACIKTTTQFLKDNFWSREDIDLAQAIIKNIQISTLLSLWQAMLNALQEVKIAPCPSHALELALLRMCYLCEIPPLESILKQLSGASNGPGNNLSPTPQRQVASYSESPNPAAGYNPASSAPASNSQPPVATPDATINSAGNNNTGSYTEAPHNKQTTSNEGSPESQARHKLQDKQESDGRLENLKSFDDLLTLVENMKEPLLHNHMLQDMECVSYNAGDMVLYLKPSLPPVFLSNLQKFLDKATGMQWRIETTNKPVKGSIYDQKEGLFAIQKQQVLSHPVVQSIQSAFPGSTIEVQR